MKREQLADLALKYINYPAIKYQSPDKGMDESGFDCSGFLTFLLNKLNFPKPSHIRHCNQYFDFFGILIHPQVASKGDIVFFCHDSNYPKHLGIMISENQYIHSPGKTGQKITITKLSPKLLKPKPNQIYTHDPIGFKRLAYKEKQNRYQVIIK